MSNPRNHHFVSRIHLNQFFNTIDECIYVYDKHRNNHYTKTTTKSLFSERDLNTRLKKNSKDFKSLENDLNENFEKDFSFHLNVLKEFIKTRSKTVDIHKSLTHLSYYGLIGEFRTPRYKEFIADSFAEALTNLFPDGQAILREQIKKEFSYKKGGEYSNLNDYSEIATQIIERMGKLIFNIVIPENEDDYFVVPDCCSFTKRAKINRYFNPDIMEIAYIGTPITSKIYLHTLSEKLLKNKVNSPIITLSSEKEVTKLNEISYRISQSKIASDNKDYLTRFVLEMTSKK